MGEKTSIDALPPLLMHRDASVVTKGIEYDEPNNGKTKSTLTVEILFKYFLKDLFVYDLTLLLLFKYAETILSTVFLLNNIGPKFI